MLRIVHEQHLHSHNECKSYLGKMFRVKFPECPEWQTDTEVTDFILKHCVLIHLNSNEDKFNMLVFMTQKLFVFAQDKCKIEGADAVMMQELLLGGHLYLQVVKERLQVWLRNLRLNILKRARNVGFVLDQKEMSNSAKFAGGLEIVMEKFLATGHIYSDTGLGLMQDKGLTIVAENINRMRYMSHFRSVHRGAFFQEMRTTEARQLLPDAWGFICPVHTPDGAPCGLLNHLTMNCIVTDLPDETKCNNIPSVLTELGMLPIKNVQNTEVNVKDCYVAQLDGKVIGYVQDSVASQLVEGLRLLKIKGEVIPDTMEIVLVPKKKVPGQFPGLFIFTSPARMMRPLNNLVANQIEYIGTFEQLYLDICITPEESYKGKFVHFYI